MMEIDFKNVTPSGLESSPYATELAGLRANEARYYWNHFKTKFITFPASERPDVVQMMDQIVAERDLKFKSKPLEVADFTIERVRHLYVFYQNGLSINVMYDLVDPQKRAVGFKLSDHMEILEEFEGKFKFAKMHSKLAGTIRGSYFKIKQEYPL
ncbi:hypothetical protein [Ligilactobacillus araffinosus]|uniref:Phage tail protein n=1 Tax=Ligilactobacillus araffinosus DSM 20653 TaxID=1423820 RepID=A0A0R1ZKU8_9LACO|nr:hypothetical protein [Ligilactobacillus araffinosus]KRM52246.1 hypothetical protein FC64_GL000670 [Ligilactobacillus araffinosus DSM 20653]